MVKFSHYFISAAVFWLCLIGMVIAENAIAFQEQQVDFYSHLEFLKNNINNAIAFDVLLFVLVTLILFFTFNYITFVLLRAAFNKSGKNAHIHLLMLLSSLIINLAVYGVHSHYYQLSQFTHILPQFDKNLLAAMIMCLIIIFIVGTVRLVIRKERLVLLGCVTALLGLLLITENYHSHTKLVSNKKNIIIIGVDSFRPDVLERDLKSLKNITGFINNSVSFSNAFTPLARTFPSWISILTGRTPKQTNARFNLSDFDTLKIDNNLPSTLRRAGYNTVWAMDDRRYNNIDKKYGYDNVIGPKVGAPDFILEKVSDNPITNFVRKLEISKYLYPYSFSNRAHFNGYYYHDFNESILSAIKENNSAPLFLNVHFCLVHWPYKSNLTEDYEETPFTGNSVFQQYLKMTKEVDNQVGDFIKGLSEMGLLDDSLIFLISDHGESFFHERDQLKNVVEGGSIMDFGHGTNVLIESQYRVLLSYQVRENGRIINEKKSMGGLASLMDIYPTVMDYVGLSYFDEPINGKSLFGVERHNFLTLESSLRPSFDESGNIDKVKTLNSTRKFYGIRGDGSVVFKKGLINEAINLKDFGLVTNNHIYGTLHKENKFIKVDRETRNWSIIEPKLDIKEKALDSLCGIFYSELSDRVYMPCDKTIYRE